MTFRKSFYLLKEKSRTVKSILIKSENAYCMMHWGYTQKMYLNIKQY
jgi:hypothetical protein